MSSRRLLFRTLYRLGMTPWDGHPLAASLRGLVEGGVEGFEPLPPGAALDLGCGTGDSSIYLARHGWMVTGVDYIEKPLHKARAKAEAQGVDVHFLQADVTRLRQDVSPDVVGAGFDLIIDNGCLHGMSAEDRDAYVREVTAVAAPDARLHIVAFTPGGLFGVPGITPEEVEQRFSADWTLLSSGVEAESARGNQASRYYLFAASRRRTA
ncbi:class I SAM-dependent methyltransferase [Mycolicibacterium thermoresistibile]|jgi:SAM-dependent methyltransferase|uniref:Methyltransferase type 12 n=2 Tax=Mycolicibacterium thermoresistibile TaxID=1797 RepID=G7CGG8_MYCT3|nr:class I SAM-dependent methyltransferase [Mycolicibacterium thermoresistibile]EHI11928.1 methyltransferase type 12 [Mycolicibacterium thermoresistibile ATCC 19527]MCV7188994.1 class I SAM-dependent methyltransferase [Mycolicibacterium thermoresistibile]GAT14820.1 methyltransferase type 12 [Mycolicibacterium thermoresistibile]SNW20044.1 methyl transferase type 12 [Mycolicibacterium thermoresistibile]